MSETTHPFRDCATWEWDDEHPDGWPICGDCGERQEDPVHVGFIEMGWGSDQDDADTVTKPAAPGLHLVPDIVADDQ